MDQIQIIQNHMLAGPKSRQLMNLVSDNNFDNENFPWLTSQNINIGNYSVSAMIGNF